MEYILICIIGMVIGSFLNVCIYRIPKGESIVFPPSHCFHCQHKLAVWDLVPLISYVILKGRCKYCREKIALQYPAVELLVGVLFMLNYHKYGFRLECIIYMFLICLLVVVSFIDINDMVIPNKFNIIIAVIGLVNLLLVRNITIFDSLGGALVGGAMLLLIGKVGGYITQKDAMGGGDLKLLAACGFYIGIKNTLLALMLAFNYAAIIVLILLFTKKLKRNQNIPFGPFISAGVLSIILLF